MKRLLSTDCGSSVLRSRSFTRTLGAALMLGLVLSACPLPGASAQDEAGKEKTPPKAFITMGDTRINGYLSFATKLSSVNNRAAGYADFRGAVMLGEKWAIGLGASGLYYDRKLTALVQDGTYHLYAGYAGLFVERVISFSDDLKGSVSLLMGQGEAYYQYDKDFRKDKVWAQELIDRTTFSVFEPGVELRYRVGGDFWLGLTGSYRSTSPVQLIQTSESLLRKFNGGLSLTWGVF